MIGLLRALPPHGDLKAGIELMKTPKVYPLHPPEGWTETGWADLSHEFDFSPFPLEHDLGYWEVLHELIDSEPPYDGYRNEYGELAALGIAEGRPFDPDERMRDILVRAAQIANAQMRVQSFADRRSDRAVWEGTHWEWAVLRPENGTFDAQSYVDLDAREVVLPGADRVAGHVRPLPGRGLALRGTASCRCSRLSGVPRRPSRWPSGRAAAGH
jgi:hypothetical protein